MDQWKKDKENLLNEKMIEIEVKLDERPSRKDDLESIDRLKGRIQKKESENILLRK